jgi:hypothetical protein
MFSTGPGGDGGRYGGRGGRGRGRMAGHSTATGSSESSTYKLCRFFVKGTCSNGANCT